MVNRKITFELKFNRCEVELTGLISSVCTKPYSIPTWTKAFGTNVLRLSSRDGQSTANGPLSRVRLDDGNVRTRNGSIVGMKRRSKSGLIEGSDLMVATRALTLIEGIYGPLTPDEKTVALARFSGWPDAPSPFPTERGRHQHGTRHCA